MATMFFLTTELVFHVCTVHLTLLFSPKGKEKWQTGQRRGEWSTSSVCAPLSWVWHSRRIHFLSMGSQCPHGSLMWVASSPESDLTFTGHFPYFTALKCKPTTALGASDIKQRFCPALKEDLAAPKVVQNSTPPLPRRQACWWMGLRCDNPILY